MQVGGPAPGPLSAPGPVEQRAMSMIPQQAQHPVQVQMPAGAALQGMASDVPKRQLIEIAQQLATGNTIFAANAAIELGQLAASQGGIDVIITAHPARVALENLAKRLMAASLPGALRDEVQSATACAATVHLIAANEHGADFLVNPVHGLGKVERVGEESVATQIVQGLVGLMRYDPAAVAEAVCALAGLLSNTRTAELLLQVKEEIFRALLQGLVNSIFTQPVRVKEMAVEGLLFLMDCDLCRKRVYRLSKWEVLLVGELVDLSRTEPRYPMALLVSFLGYDDFRHQLCGKADALQSFVYELAVLVQNESDSMAMGCAALCALVGDEISRRQVLHLPQTTPLLTNLLNYIRPTAACPTVPASYSAPVMSCLLSLSHDIFSQVRIMSLHAEPEALPQAVLGVLLPPPWWWAPMWVDDPELKEAAQLDAVQVMLNCLGTENNCRVLRQRGDHNQTMVLPRFYVKMTMDLVTLTKSLTPQIASAATQCLCAAIAAGGIAFLGQDQATMRSLLDRLLELMNMVTGQDPDNLGAMTCEAMFMLLGGKESRKDQETATQTVVGMIGVDTLEKTILGICGLMTLTNQTAMVTCSAGRTLRLFLGGGRATGEALLSSLLHKVGKRIDHPMEHWLAPAKFVLGLGPGSADMSGGTYDQILCALSCALGSGLVERQAPAVVVLRAFVGVKQAWARLLAQNKILSRRTMSGIVAVLCAKDCPTERMHAAAIILMLTEDQRGLAILDDQEGRDIYYLLEALVGMVKSGDPTAVQLAGGTIDNLRYRAPAAWARRMDALQFPTQHGMQVSNLICQMDAAALDST